MTHLEIFLVDDDAVVNFLHKKTISTTQENLTTAAFSSGDAFVSFLKGAFDANKNYLVLLDINMPGMSGWDVVEEIEASYGVSALPIVMLTSSIDEEDKNKAASYQSVLHFESKPLTREKLKMILEKVEMVK